MRSQRYVALALGAAILLSGCTRVVVKKDPGPDDEGFRYYRPKPYLMVAPAPPTEETGAYVSITV